MKAVSYDGTPVPGIDNQLQNGSARIGWSSDDSQDLRLIQSQLEQGKYLSEGQSDAWRCHQFLDNVSDGDYFLYPHQPKRYKFRVVKITGDYEYLDYDNGVNGDFRSSRACEIVTVNPVDWYDQRVPEKMRRHLGLLGRIHKIWDTRAIHEFLERFENATPARIQDGTIDEPVRRIHHQLRKKLPDELCNEFAAAKLSRQFCINLFERMGYSSENIELKEGRNEQGSDIVVTVEHPLLYSKEGFQVGVQVFAYTGKIAKQKLQEKLEQLLAGCEKNRLDYGVLLTTGFPEDAAREALCKHNIEDDQGRFVKLIDGDDLASLFLQHYPPDTA